MKAMFIYESEWNGNKTFKLMPLINECPYLECIYNSVDKVLAVISKLHTESFRMIPKLNNLGELSKTPGGATKQDRVLLKINQEYILSNINDIVDFINIQTSENKETITNIINKFNTIAEDNKSNSKSKLISTNKK